MRDYFFNLLMIAIFCPLALFAKGSGVANQTEKNQSTEEIKKKEHSDDKNSNENHTSETAQDGKGAENESNKSNAAGGTQKGAEEAEQTLKIGNLAFPPSQQPSPLISFGQNIINRKEMQAQIVAFQLKGFDQYFINVNPAIIYAFTDSLSLFLVAPFAVRYKQDGHHSSGPNDMIIQAEYAYYTKAHRTYYDQATLVANVSIPTGSTKKNPTTGLGSNSYFIGATFSRMEINWFYFVSTGRDFIGSSHRTKFGDQYLYQFGIGRRIYNTSEWLFDWMLEFDGTYFWKDRINGKINPNSGGNVIYLTPSIWISSKDSLFFQCGIGIPIKQHLYGDQTENDYLLIMNTGWLF